MKTRFTAEAKRRIKTIRIWWRDHRPAAATLFIDELRAGLAQIRAMPDSGMPYQSCYGRRVRRVLLPRTRQFLYYSVDPARTEILVHIVWGATRGQQPNL